MRRLARHLAVARPLTLVALAAAALLATRPHASAQVVFEPPLASPAALSPTGLALGDVNEDGVPDLLIGHLVIGGKPGWLAGQGDGTFGPELAIDTTIPAASTLGAADLTGDGHVDLVLPQGQFVTLLYGSGGGAFTTGPTLTAGGGFSTKLFAFADVDEDGQTDLVVTDTGSAVFFVQATVSVYRNLGGAYTLWATLGGVLESGAACLADFNEDGHLDIALPYMGVASEVTIWFGDGQANYPNSQTFFVGSNASSRRTLAVGDWNGDGHADWAFTDASSVSWRYGAGDGTFSVGGSLPTTSEARTLLAADFDGDGLDDLVTADQLFVPLHVYRSLGAGGFEDDLQITASTSAHFTGAVVADPNGDGRPDLVGYVGAAFSQVPTVLLNHTYGAGSPVLDLGHALPGGAGYPVQLVEGTFTGGTPFEFSLHTAKPSGSAWHVVGTTLLNAPFKGGVMVPSPDFLSGPWPLSASGALTIAGAWPLGVPAGLQAFFQFWFPDAAAIKGQAASSGVRVTMP